MQNIGEANSGDAFYRYKMPKLVARIEGRGNGIKTNVVNNVDIAKALERPPEYIVKYYGCELGAQTKFDAKTGTSIVNGAHDTGKLCELLEGFIKKYVQCYSCGNPETQVKIKKECIFLKCKACGFISEVDMRHRLNTFIVKNPPEEKLSKAEKKLKKQEKERLKELAIVEDKPEKKDKSSKKKKKKGENNSPEGSGADENEEPKPEPEEEEEGDGDGEDVVWMTDTSADAVKKRAEEQLTSATAAMVTQGNIEAEQEEASKAAKREAKRKAEEEAKRKEEEAKREEEARKKAEEERLAQEAAEKLAINGNGSASSDVTSVRQLIASKSPKDVAAAVRKLDVEGGLAGRMRVLYEALFGDLGSSKLAPEMSKRKAVLMAAAGGDAASQMAQVVALEHLVGVTLPDKSKEISLALKVLYDEDIVVEDLIVAWYDKPAAGKVLSIPPTVARTVRECARPFVEWLKEAESDEEDESEEEEEEDED